MAKKKAATKKKVTAKKAIRRKGAKKKATGKNAVKKKDSGKAVRKKAFGKRKAIKKAMHVLTREVLLSRLEEVENDFPTWDEYTGIDDDAAECLSRMSISYLGLEELREVSDASLLLLSSISDITLNEALVSRALSLRVSIEELSDAGFFAYADSSLPHLTTLSYGGSGLGAAYKVTDETGECHDVRRVFGADVEELVAFGLSWFFTHDLSHLGIDPSVIEETASGETREWCYDGCCYPISGDDIDHHYNRAAYALVAILNQILAEAGSDERAYGVNEGHAFGIAFLTEPLSRIIAKVADADNKPISQKQLKKIAQPSIGSNEPPLVRRR